VSTSLEETDRNLRLVILGLDGLDPHLVDRWEMDWFKQKVWGRHYVGFLKKLYTPIVWGCFLTGLNVEKLGYDLKSLRIKRTAEAFRNKLLRKAFLLRAKIPIAKLGIRRLLVKLRQVEPYPKAIMPAHLLKRTFLEELKSNGLKTFAVEVPGYNEVRNEYYRTKHMKLVSAPFRERANLVREALEDTQLRADEAIKYVEQDYDVVFVYTPLPDIAFHCAIKPTLRVKLWLREVQYSLYNTFNELLNLASEKGYAVLMVSDHGELLGEYNLYFYPKINLPQLKIVPWFTIK